MHWVVQSNIFHEENYEHLLSTLDRLSLSYSTHKVVPFVGTIDPEPTLPDGTDVIVMGSYALARYAQRRGWRPGAFVDNLEFELQREHWGERMLNADATVVPFAAIPFQREPFVLRPVLDTKSFTGMVIDWGEYESWRDRILALETAGEDSAGLGLGSRDATMLCTLKEIWSETRTWIVDGEVVTCSGYKLGRRTRYAPPELVDPAIVAFAREAAQHWSPNRAYVLDVAETPDGMRIVEVNNLNSAGWYRCDMQRLVIALEGMTY